MALDLNRWFKYAKARVDAVFASGHEELDEMEAEREAILAEQPWLASDREKPTLDEARARIEWESRRQARSGEDSADRSDPTPPRSPKRPAESPTGGIDGEASESSPGSEASGPARPVGAADAAIDPQTGLPLDGEAAADAASAKLELETKRRRTAERLAEMRRELGIDDPGSP